MQTSENCFFVEMNRAWANQNAGLDASRRTWLANWHLRSPAQIKSYLSPRKLA
jgi:hypothetical protein